MSRYRLGLIGVAFTWLAVWATTGWAQTASGITGVVRDTSGAVLPGVTVEAASPELIEKVRSVVSEIWVHITRVTHMTRVAQVQIHLRNGTIKKLTVQHTSGLRAKSRKSI